MILNFQVQVDAEENNVDYIKYRLHESVRGYANVKAVVYERYLTDVDRSDEKKEYTAWLNGFIDL